MKDEMFRAEDGAFFTKAKDCRMYNEIQKHAQKHAHYTYYTCIDKIERLKCRAWANSPSHTTPIYSNIESCHWLPLIEILCKNAREAYIQALNEPGRIDRPDRVYKIFEASRVYDYALRKRSDLIAEYRQLKAKAKEAYTELYAAKMLKESCI